MLLQFGYDFIWMIAVVKQNRNLWDIHRLGTKVVQVLLQQFNQANVIADIGFSAVSKKRQTEGINRKVALDAISAFVMTEPFRLDTGIAGILHCLRVNDQ